MTPSQGHLSDDRSEPAAAPRDRAWGVLLGACLCMFCGQASVAYYTFGVFLPEIVADTHWSGVAVAATIGAGALVAAIMAPVAGAMSDRFGVRAVALIGAPAYAAGFALLGLLPWSPGSFAAVTIVAWALIFAGSPVPYAQMLAGWFDRRRGMALGVMFATGSLGIAAWSPYAAFLIARLGWRHAYVAMGASAAAVILFAAIFLLRTPARAGPGSADAPSGLAVVEALRTARFWKLAAIFMLLTAVLGGAAVTFPLILRQHGADPSTASLAMTVIGIGMFLGRLVLSLLLDRVFSPHVAVGITCVSVVALLLVAFGSAGSTLVIAAALLGFGLGSEYAISAYMVSRAFGTRAFGSIYGLVTSATSVGAALGPAIIGATLMSSGDKHAIFLAATAILIVPLLILLSLGRDDLPFGGAAREEA